MANDPPLAGKWTYRSYINSRDLVNDAAGALALIFGQGILTFVTPTNTSLLGTLDMGSGLVLDLQGTIKRGAQDEALTIAIVGNGRAGTQTDGWEYDYHGYLAYQWPNGVNQVPAFIGSVIRAKPHNGSPAGFVASFIAVRQS
jgi:hypothetical protein